MVVVETGKAKNTHIEVFFLYVGNKEIESVRKSIQPLDGDSVFKKHDVVNMIRRNQRLNKERYKLISLLRYNTAIDGEELLGMNATDSDGTDFLHVERHIDDMTFPDTVNVLQHVNAVFFVFSRDHPRRVKGESNSETRRIIFNDKFRKTRRGRKKLKGMAYT